jgi:hypothetical protein
MGSAIWGIVGSLIGVVVGVWLTARWQHSQWIRDNKRAEYREIFDALNGFRWRLSHFQAIYGESPFVDRDAEGQKRDRQEGVMEALTSAVSALGDRIFIRESVLRSHVIQEFQGFYHALQTDNAPDVAQAAHTLGVLHGKLLLMAWRDLRLGQPPADGEARHATPGGPPRE